MAFQMIRPWGRMWKLLSGKRFWVKVLWVSGRTSLQAHRERTEWHVGLYKVRPMEKHRLQHGAFVEFVHGRRAAEDDIIRYADDYGRALDKEVVVAVSGGFDPLHIGHLELFEEAKKLGDKLVVILNNDNWLAGKKGKPFMSEVERKKIVESVQWVDEVILTDHAVGEYAVDRSSCRTLRAVKPDIFANGGDRHPEGDPIPEVDLCNELGIKLVYNVGKSGKLQSSSELLKKYVQAGE